MNGIMTQMIGLVLVTHGRLADEFVTAMEHVVGPQKQVLTVAIGPDDDMEARRADIRAATKAGVATAAANPSITSACSARDSSRKFAEAATASAASQSTCSSVAQSSGRS